MIHGGIGGFFCALILVVLYARHRMACIFISRVKLSIDLLKILVTVPREIIAETKILMTKNISTKINRKRCQYERVIKIRLTRISSAAKIASLFAIKVASLSLIGLIHISGHITYKLTALAGFFLNALLRFAVTVFRFIIHTSELILLWAYRIIGFFQLVLYVSFLSLKFSFQLSSHYLVRYSILYYRLFWFAGVISHKKLVHAYFIFHLILTETGLSIFRVRKFTCQVINLFVQQCVSIIFALARYLATAMALTTAGILAGLITAKDILRAGVTLLQKALLFSRQALIFSHSAFISGYGYLIRVQIHIVHLVYLLLLRTKIILLIITEQFFKFIHRAELIAINLASYCAKIFKASVLAVSQNGLAAIRHGFLALHLIILAWLKLNIRLISFVFLTAIQIYNSTAFLSIRVYRISIYLGAVAELWLWLTANQITLEMKNAHAYWKNKLNNIREKVISIDILGHLETAAENATLSLARRKYAFQRGMAAVVIAFLIVNPLALILVQPASAETIVISDENVDPNNPVLQQLAEVIGNEGSNLVSDIQKKVEQIQAGTDFFSPKASSSPINGPPPPNLAAQNTDLQIISFNTPSTPDCLTALSPPSLDAALGKWQGVNSQEQSVKENAEGNLLNTSPTPMPSPSPIPDPIPAPLDSPTPELLLLPGDSPQPTSEPQVDESAPISVEPVRVYLDLDFSATASPSDQPETASNETSGDELLDSPAASASFAPAATVFLSPTPTPTPQPCAPTTQQISNDGSFSETEKKFKQLVEIINTNSIKVTNEVKSKALTGLNQIVSQDSGKDAGIESGDINVFANVLNVVNTNLYNSKITEIVENFNNLATDVMMNHPETAQAEIIQDMVTEVCGELQCQSLNSFTLTNKNQAEVENNVDVLGDSGKNLIKNIEERASILSGNVNALVNILNIVNTNLINSRWTIASINIFGDWDGDLVLPSELYFTDYLSIGATGNSDISVTDIKKIIINVGNDNAVEVINNVDVGADSGYNAVEATGALPPSTAKGEIEDSSIGTGGSDGQSNVKNFLNTNVINGKWFMGMVNTLGQWSGGIFSLPDEVALVTTPTGLTFFSTNTKENDPIYTKFEETVAEIARLSSTSININNDNRARIVNNVDLKSLSGENEIEANQIKEAGILSGNTYALANILNFANTNLVNADLHVGMVNVFGHWKGNVVFGYPDITIDQRLIQDYFPKEKNKRVNYEITYNNLGSSSMIGSSVVWEYSSELLQIKNVDSPYQYREIEPGTLEFDLRRLRPNKNGRIGVELKTLKNLAPGGEVQTYGKIFGLGPEKNKRNNDSLLVAFTAASSSGPITDYPEDDPPPLPSPPQFPSPTPSPTSEGLSPTPSLSPSPTPTPSASISPTPTPTPANQSENTSSSNQGGGTGQSGTIITPSNNQSTNSGQTVTELGVLKVKKISNAENRNIKPGTSVDFTVIVQNDGLDDLFNVVIQDTLIGPDGKIIYTKLFPLGRMPSMEEVKNSYSVDIPLSATPGKYTNTAQVEALNYRFQPVRSQTSSATSFTVEAPPKTIVPIDASALVSGQLPPTETIKNPASLGTEKKIETENQDLIEGKAGGGKTVTAADSARRSGISNKYPASSGKEVVTIFSGNLELASNSLSELNLALGQISAPINGSYKTPGFSQLLSRILNMYLAAGLIYLLIVYWPHLVSAGFWSRLLRLRPKSPATIITVGARRRCDLRRQS